MFKLIFSGIHVRHRVRFWLFLALYLATLAAFLYVCTLEGIFSRRLEDNPGILLLFPGMGYAVYHGPLAAVLFAAVSFFEILLTAWQTDLAGQRLNRFVLFFLAVDLTLAAIGIAIPNGPVAVLLSLAVLALILVLPTVIVIKVKEKNGTYDYADILTPEEREERKGK